MALASSARIIPATVFQDADLRPVSVVTTGTARTAEISWRQPHAVALQIWTISPEEAAHLRQFLHDLTARPVRSPSDLPEGDVSLIRRSR